MPVRAAFITQLGSPQVIRRLITAMLVDGSLTVRISGVLPLAATAQVHTRLEAGRVDGRLLLRPEHCLEPVSGQDRSGSGW